MLKYILSALTGAIICFLLLRTCTPVVQQPGHTKNYDSLLAKAHRDSIAYTTHIGQLEMIIDDKTELTDSIYLSLSDKLERNQFTLAKLRTAKAGRDTITFVQSCDTLVSEYNTLVAQGLKYKFERDTLIDALRKTKTTDSIEHNRLNVFNNSLRASVDTATQIAFKWQKIAGKRWSIGVGGGYGVGKNGLTPYGGTSLQYQLFKF